MLTQDLNYKKRMDSEWLIDCGKYGKEMKLIILLEKCRKIIRYLNPSTIWKRDECFVCT